MEEQAVREYVERTESVIQDSPQMGEATTKAAILRDFLELLGWNIPTNTELEYSVEAFGRTFRVDYALLLEGAPVAFLEAKGADTPLTDDHREQIQEYMKSEDVNLGILTNGEEYSFFRRQVVNSKVEIKTLAETNLENLPDRITILRAFTTEAIQNDEWVNILNRIEELQDAQSTLKAEKGRFAARITEVLTRSVSDVISSQAESQAKEMIDRLIEDIEHEVNSDAAGSQNDADDGVTSSESLTTISGEYVVKIQNGEQTLSIFGDNYQSDVMADVVGYLIENHELIPEMDSIPYVPGSKNAVINDSPVHPDGREMETYRELPGGHYLFTNLSKDDKMRYVRRFAEKCNLEVEFKNGW